MANSSTAVAPGDNALSATERATIAGGYVLLGVVGTVANVFLVYLFARFKELRQQVGARSTMSQQCRTPTMPGRTALHGAAGMHESGK